MLLKQTERLDKIYSMCYNDTVASTHKNSILTKSFRWLEHLYGDEALTAAKQSVLCGGAFYFYIFIIPYFSGFVNQFDEKT